MKNPYCEAIRCSIQGNLARMGTKLLKCVFTGVGEALEAADVLGGRLVERSHIVLACV